MVTMTMKTLKKKIFFIKKQQDRAMILINLKIMLKSYFLIKVIILIEFQDTVADWSFDELRQVILDFKQQQDYIQQQPQQMKSSKIVPRQIQINSIELDSNISIDEFRRYVKCKDQQFCLDQKINLNFQVSEHIEKNPLKKMINEIEYEIKTINLNYCVKRKYSDFQSINKNLQIRKKQIHLLNFRIYSINFKRNQYQEYFSKFFQKGTHQQNDQIKKFIERNIMAFLIIFIWFLRTLNQIFIQFQNISNNLDQQIKKNTQLQTNLQNYYKDSFIPSQKKFLVNYNVIEALKNMNLKLETINQVKVYEKVCRTLTKSNPSLVPIELEKLEEIQNETANYITQTNIYSKQIFEETFQNIDAIIQKYQTTTLQDNQKHNFCFYENLVWIEFFDIFKKILQLMSLKYETIISQFLEKLKPKLPLKNNQIKDALQTFLGQNHLEFGNHIILFKWAIQIKSQKIKELTIQTLINLVSKGYIKGSLIDKSDFYPQEIVEINENRLKKIVKAQSQQNVIESLIKIVSLCLMEKEEIVQLSLKLLISLILSPFCDIQQHELQKIIKTVVYFYAQSKSQQIEKMCKSILFQIIHFTFQGSCCEILVKYTIDCMLNQISDEKKCVYCKKLTKLTFTINNTIFCSLKCKQQFQQINEIQQKSYSSASNILDLLIRLLSSKQQFQQLRIQQIILECIYYICNNFEFILSSLIIQNLCAYLLKFCLYNEPQLYQLSFKIFQRLVFSKHREMINQINIFINQIYLNIITNKSFTDQHKITAFESLLNIFQRKEASLEFYLNFDCSTKHELLMENLINNLHQVFQQNEQFRYIISQIFMSIISGIDYAFTDKFIQRQALDQEQHNDNDETVYVNQLELQRQQKFEIQKGAELFNKNPQKGIDFLLKANLLSNNPESIATFMQQNKQLTKEAVGLYLGGHHQINIDVLRFYTNFLNFQNYTVEQALRQYLDLFILPPEAQQIDRIVQKFADKFYEDNQQSPNILFKSSSSIYTFTYLLVMLQTDLHNPKVIDKMKLTDFTKLAKTINDGDDLPSDYLTQTYQNIQKSPLAVRDSSTTINPLQKVDAYQKQVEEILKKVRDLIKNQPDSNYIDINSETILLSKVIIESNSQQILEVFLTMYETYFGDEIIKNILQLMKLQAKLSTQIDAKVFQVALSNLKKGNNMLIFGLISIVPFIGNWITEQSWFSIFDALSFINEQNSMDSDLTEKVFISSKDLSNTQIEVFINQLCNISKQEIYSKQRVFALQKIVEVSDYNMDRVKLIWSRLWVIVSQHISEVAIKEKKITIFAVDSLKQLNIKFLQKEEQFNIEFQREVLKPFEIIFQQSNLEVKEFILSCLKQILQNHKTNIKSGFKVIFNVINLGLKEEDERISLLALDLLSIVEIRENIMVEIIQTLQILGRKENEQMALSSIKFVRKCLKFIEEQQNIVDVQKLKEQQNLWVPLLGILSNQAGDKRLSVQTEAVKDLFDVLENFGDRFDEEFWKMIFSSVIRPIFDEIQYTISTNPELNESWFKNSCQKVFQNISKLLKRHFNKLIGQLPDFLRLFENCMLNQNERLAQFSIISLKSMIVDNGDNYEKQDWSQIINFIQKMLKQTIPQKLYDISGQNNESETYQIGQLKRQQSFKIVMNNLILECYSQCASQLKLISVIDEIIKQFYSKLDINDLSKLQDALNESYTFAYDFNKQIDKRYKIWKCGFQSNMDTLPGLLKQEREAYSCVLVIIEQKLKILKNQDQSQDSYEQILSFCLKKILDAIQLFNQKHLDLINNQQDNSEDEIIKLKNQEAVRDIQNYKIMMDVSTLPILIRILNSNDTSLIPLKQMQKDIHKELLISIGFANEQNLISCEECKKLNRYNQQKSKIFQQIMECLEKLYELK